jgi:hypothetical protein
VSNEHFVTWRKPVSSGNGRLRPHINPAPLFGADLHLLEMRSFYMLTTVARWTHNTLLLAVALLTVALVLFAI